MKKNINKEWIISVVLWFFLGCLGGHRFFAGKIGTGILMILTFGGLGIWWLIDGIILLIGNFSKKDGEKITFYENHN